MVIQVAAAATKAEATPTAEPRAAVAQQQTKKPLTLELRLEHSKRNARKARGTIRFYENNPELLASGAQRAKARAGLREAKHRLAKAERSIAKLRKAIAARDARRLASLPPKQAICKVFDSHCSQAVNVAWCESRLQVTAQNGQYLGIFQMGSYERQLFGHGSTAYAQAVAAHKYFVRSGRDWSPWSCRWAAS
jgi:hypothetical protein